MRKLRSILPEAVITVGLAFSRSASFHRRAFRRRDWNDLSESQRWDRIHGYDR
jgi:hypothetical protein